MANDFAPQGNSPNAPSFLNYSRGVEDNTFSSLFRGVAEGLDTGAKAIDRGFTQQVKDEVRASVETADASMGIVSNPRTQDPMPTELANNIEKLKAAKESMLTGRMPSAHYYARLHTEAKRIRSRWGGADGASGYTEQIDDAFKELIGTTPANALRRQQFANEEAARSAAAASRNSREAFATAIIKSGSVPPEFVDTIAIPGMVDNDEYYYNLRSAVAAREAERNTIEMGNLRLESEIKKGNVNKERAANQYTKVLSVRIDDLVRRGVDYTKLQQMTEAANRERLAGRTVDPRKNQEIQALFNIVSNQVEGIIAEERAKFAGFEYIREEAGAVEDLVRGPIKQIGQGLADENFGIIKSASLNLKILRESSEGDLLKNSTRLQKIDSLRKIVGDTAFEYLLANQGYTEILSPVTEFYEQAAKADAAVAAGRSLSDTIDTLKSDLASNPEASKETGKVINRILKDLPSKLRDPKVPEDVRYNIAKNIYNSNNAEFWARLPADKRGRVYRDMINPENFKAVQALAARDPQLLKDYETTVIDFSNATARSSVSTLNSISTSVSDRVVRYNPTTNQVSVDAVAAPKITNTNPASRFVQSANNRINTIGVGDATVEINNLLKSFEPIWQAQGIPKERWGLEGRQMLQLFGLNLDKSGTNLYESIRGTETGRMNLSQEVQGQFTRRVYSPQEGTQNELDETIQLYNNATTEEERSTYKRQIFELMSLDPELMSSGKPMPVQDGTVILEPSN